MKVDYKLFDTLFGKSIMIEVQGKTFHKCFSYYYNHVHKYGYHTIIFNIKKSNSVLTARTTAQKEIS